MKETRFIAQNKEKWREAETLLKSTDKDPEKLSNLFTQVVDDLSYSRTYYPNRSVRVYLNKIARQYFSIIYGGKKGKKNQFKLFWLEDLPQVIIYARVPLLISLVVFLLAVVIGVFSSVNDPQFVNTILGNEYVSMTEGNIANGDPMAVYKQSHQMDMFLGITFNNLMVAFRTYVLGIFLGIGTIGSLLQNGIMVGSFQYFFVERGLFLESSLTIWLHGTLEISSIILAGGAGLTLGRGLIFPGTYSRIQSLQISGIRSLQLMMGITPVFILAAIIESFLTRYTGAPLFLKLILILLSLAYIVGYFAIYPWLKSKKGFTSPLKEIRLQAGADEPIDLKKIKSNADLLKNALQFYSRHSNAILSTAFFLALGLSSISLALQEESFLVEEPEWWIAIFTDMLAALVTPSPLFIVVNGFATSIALYRVMKLIDLESKKISAAFDIKSFLQLLGISLLIYAAIYLGAWGIFFLLILFGFLLFVGFTQLTSNSNLGFGFAQGWELYRKNDNQGFFLQFFVTLLCVSFLIVLSAPLLYIHLHLVQWNFAPDEKWSTLLIHFLESFIKIFSFYLVLPVLTASISYLYFSQEEANDATHLKEAISKIGLRHAARR